MKPLLLRFIDLRNAVAGLGLASVVATGSFARADEKQACSDAYDRTQALRREGKLQAARNEAAACMRDACAEFIRTDCVKWLGEIDASQPTIVLEVRDGAGRETSAVRVTLDGKPWLSDLDGKAKPIDPGAHKIRFELEGAPPIDEAVQIREGEKNRKVTASFLSPVATSPVESPKSTPHETTSAPSRSIAPWIVGGVGVAGLAVGAITGGIALSQKSINGEHCSEVTKTCDAEGRSAASTGRVVGPISTVGLIVGGLGVGVSAVWLLTRGPAAKTVAMGPIATTTGGAWRFSGSF